MSSFSQALTNWARAAYRTYGKHYFTNAFRWKLGRQGTGYQKMLLATAPWPLPFDVLLIRYPEGSEIPTHVDPAPAGRQHFRINVVLKESASGGKFVCPGALYTSRRLNYFRPDISPHSVTKVVGGTRYIFSIGWLRSTPVTPGY